MLVDRHVGRRPVTVRERSSPTYSRVDSAMGWDLSMIMQRARSKLVGCGDGGESDASDIIVQ